MLEQHYILKVPEMFAAEVSGVDLIGLTEYKRLSIPDKEYDAAIAIRMVKWLSKFEDEYKIRGVFNALIVMAFVHNQSIQNQIKVVQYK